MENLVAVTIKSEWMVEWIYDWPLGEDAYTSTNCTSVDNDKKKKKNNGGLLHLKSIPPLWKILESVSHGECEFSNASTFCVIFRLGSSQRE